MGSSLSAAPWKLVVPLIVVGLVLIGVGLVALRLVWPAGEPRPSVPETVDRTLSMQPAPTGAQPSPAVATLSALPQTQNVSAPVTAHPPVVDLAPQRGAALDAATVSSAPISQTTPAPATVASAPPAPVAPAPRTGKVRFSIKPWGEIIIDGKTRGVSPPIKELSIPEGRHRIEIRNGAFPGYEGELDIKSGSSDSISYSFKAS